MSLLITGGSGFVGANVIEQVEAKSFERIYCLSRSPHNNPPLPFANGSWIKGDVCDKNLLDKLPNDIKFVIHMAGSTSLWRPKDFEQSSTNVLGTRNICSFALERGVEKLVFTSSIVTIGNHMTPPVETTLSNADGININYYQSKLKAEKIVKGFISKGLRAVILNPTVIIGRKDFGGWSRLIKLVGKNLMPVAGSGIAGFANAFEVARAHIFALNNGTPGQQYILSGPNHTNLEFVNEIRRQLGKRTNSLVAPKIVLTIAGYLAELASYIVRVEPPITSAGAFLLNNNVWGDDSKAISDLGYRHVELSESVRQCINWMKQSKMI